jgi:hypothetical protein
VATAYEVSFTLEGPGQPGLRDVLAELLPRSAVVESRRTGEGADAGTDLHSGDTADAVAPNEDQSSRGVTVRLLVEADDTSGAALAARTTLGQALHDAGLSEDAVTISAPATRSSS